VFYLVFGSRKVIIKIRLQTAVIIVPQRIAACPARRQALGIPADDAVVPEELAARTRHAPEPPVLCQRHRANVC
jgi:hypothetical protein